MMFSLGEPSLADKIGFLITMIIVLSVFIYFEIKNWWEDRKEKKMSEEPTLSLEELGEIKTVRVYNQAYVDKQQKRIEELEAENAELNDKLNNLASVAEVRLANWQKYEKENATLKELCTLRKMRIEDLEEQIKQMKCCGNCGKWENCEKDEMFSQDICGDWELER